MEKIYDKGCGIDVHKKMMMRLLLKHLDELNAIIRELDDDIDNFMKPKEKLAVKMLQDIAGIGNTSAQAIIAQFTRIREHHGTKRTYVAVAHSILVVIYHILRDGTVFKDLGADYYNQFNKERKINAYPKNLKALSWEGSVVVA